MITLFSRKFKSTNGTLDQEMITIKANHPASLYKPYNYFGVYCSPEKDGLTISRYDPDGPYTEWLLRARRCVAFADISGLKPIKYNARKHEEFVMAIRSSCNVDHPTVWESPNGTLFLLNEPYTPLLDGGNALVEAGFTYINVPINLSPYCGGGQLGTGSLGTQPGTRSYLITKSEHQAELASIQSKLTQAEKNAPAWNDISGVSNV